MRGLKNKVAIVTGGAGGIGSATVRRLVEEGCKVAIADINIDGAEALAKELGAGTIAIHFDALDNESTAAMVESVAAHFGRIDILDNNHALINDVASVQDTTILDVPYNIWDDVMAANVRSYVVTCRHAIPHMLKVGGGSIINFSSISGCGADVVLSAYAASKAAVVAFTRSVAAQYGKEGIRCNSIAPGMVVTPSVRAFRKDLVAIMEKHTPNARVGSPEDAAALVAFLASEDSGYIQGQLINLDGGILTTLPFIVDTRGMWTNK